jgi:hypothetical protein
VKDRPVDYAIATEGCTKCNAPAGTPCKVEIRGFERNGAHRIRLDDAKMIIASLVKPPEPETTS